jgi:hypothetical protein
VDHAAPAEDRQGTEGREGETSASGADHHRRGMFRWIFSKLREALSCPVYPSRPVRPSLLLEKSQLNATYASLDDLEILITIGTYAPPFVSSDCTGTCVEKDWGV